MHPIAGDEFAERGVPFGVFDDGQLNAVVVQRVHGEAHAVHRDGAVCDHERSQGDGEYHIDEPRIADLFGTGNDAEIIDVAEYHVAAESITEAHGALEVDTSAGRPGVDGGPTERGDYSGDGEPPAAVIVHALFAHRQARAIGGDAFAVDQVGIAAADAQFASGRRVGDVGDKSQVVHEPREHPLVSLQKQRRRSSGRHPVPSAPRRVTAAPVRPAAQEAPRRPTGRRRRG